MLDTNNDGQISSKEAVTFYTKNRQYVWSAIAFIVGLFGGNVDRINDFVPDINGPIIKDVRRVDGVASEALFRVDELEERVSILEKHNLNDTHSTQIKVE